jgi:hypothetical protein
MKRSLTLAAALMLAVGTAYASHCPTDVKKIDEALAKNPKMSEADMKAVKDMRNQGEADHKAGKHKEAEENLHKAMEKLGIKH